MPIFEIEYADKDVERIVSSLDKYATHEAQEEFRVCFHQLKTEGAVFEAIPTNHPNLNVTVWEVYRQRFKFTYTFAEVQNRRVVKIWTFHVLPLYEQDEWMKYFENNRIDAEELDCLYITQVDQPPKIIQAIKLVGLGKRTPLELGTELGHIGKERSIERHGSYVGRIAYELNLLTTTKQGRRHIYELTEIGRRIAFSQNREVEERVLAEAMIRYEPMRVILQEIREDKPFSLEFVQQIIDCRLCPHEHKKTTSFRRAQALRTWTIWLCQTMGIPIYYEGSDGKQLYIPYIYADSAF